jgi:RNA polymerase sigma-70 factor (ECF subfamily)
MWRDYVEAAQSNHRLTFPLNAQPGSRSRQVFLSFFKAPVSELNAEVVGEEFMKLAEEHREISRLPSEHTSGENLPPDETSEVTQWLAGWKAGDRHAVERLLPLVYNELHRQAVRFFGRERAGHTLQPTALVNEAYLRLIHQDGSKWQNRAQFFGIAAQMMRRILVSHARSRHAEKRGGAMPCITLDAGVAPAPERDVNLLALDEALKKLEAIDPDKSRMVELRFFSGLSVEETAELMGVSPRTIDRQWQTAKAWLYREIGR